MAASCVSLAPLKGWWRPLKNAVSQMDTFLKDLVVLNLAPHVLVGLCVNAAINQTLRPFSHCSCHTRVVLHYL